MEPASSSTVGHAAPNSMTKSRAGAGASYMSTPTIASPSPECSPSFAVKSGNSSRQGTQLGPQKFTITGRPRSDARSNAAPSSVVPTIAGTGWPREIGLSGDPDGAGPDMAGRSRTRARVAIAAATSPTTTSRRCRSSWSAVTGLPYLTVSVPFIASMGWIEQMKT